MVNLYGSELKFPESDDGDGAEFTDLVPRGYVSELAPSSVNFTIYFWTASRQANVLALIDDVFTGVKNGLDHAHIDMPYPQVVVHGDGREKV